MWSVGAPEMGGCGVKPRLRELDRACLRVARLGGVAEIGPRA